MKYLVVGLSCYDMVMTAQRSYQEYQIICQLFWINMLEHVPVIQVHDNTTAW